MLSLNGVEHHFGAVKLGFQPHPHLRQEESSRSRAFVGTASREQCRLRFGGSFCIFVRWSQGFAVTAGTCKRWGQKYIAVVIHTPWDDTHTDQETKSYECNSF